MAESNWTAYAAAVATLLSTELNSLADGSNAIMSSGYNNSSNLDFYMDLEIYLATVNLSGQDNPAIYLWLLKSLDDTNYSDGGASVTPAHEPDIIVPVRAVNDAQRIVVPRPLILSPGHGKVLFGNRAGAALASSGNTLKYRVYSEQTA